MVVCQGGISFAIRASNLDGAFWLKSSAFALFAFQSLSSSDIRTRLGESPSGHSVIEESRRVREREENPDEGEDRSTSFRNTRESGRVAIVLHHSKLTEPLEIRISRYNRNAREYCIILHHAIIS